MMSSLPTEFIKTFSPVCFCLAYYDGEPAGTIKFQLEDPRFWPDCPGNHAAYVHRIAVRRRFAGKGVSTGMLSWAVSHAAALGRSYLRLDCEADRRELRLFKNDSVFAFIATGTSDPIISPATNT